MDGQKLLLDWRDATLEDSLWQRSLVPRLPENRLSL